VTDVRRLVDAAMEATIVPSFSRIGYQVRQHLYPDWDPQAGLDLTGRTVLVTGANSGLGKATATGIARLGARLVMLVRSDEKADDARADIIAETGNEDIGHVVADLADLASVRDAAAQLRDQEDRLDVVVHNAGAMFSQRRETGDGIETTFQVHVVGPFLLTGLLMPLLRESAPARVIWVSSGGMYTEKLDVATVESPDDYQPARAYARAKRAQVVLTEELAGRVAPTAVSFHAMHPGWAATPGVERSLPGFNKVMGPILRDPAQGADTSIWLAASPEVADRSGEFWLDRRPRSRHKLPVTRADEAEAERLYAKVVAQAGIDPATWDG
jgi:dehydrogenase/reductase SDR family protein 12